ncbi:MAG: hypothetical protein J6M48_06315 [Ruminococcus sp.]|nr:hypothetical protein [Ruminococcus sp.]
MYQMSNAFKEAFYDQSKVHRIRGSLTELSGAVIDLADKIWDDKVEIRKQCVCDEKIFAFGQMYTGELNFSAVIPEINREEIRGAEVTLELGVEGVDEWLPLGKWTITDPQRSAEGVLTIRGVDCTAKLDVPIPDSYVGTVYLSGMMRRVTELTGVEFAQTPEEVMAIVGDDGYEPWGSSFPATCRAAVVAIAQYIGGIAYADRQGRIAFRRYGSSTVLTIPAALRHSIRLGEYSCGVRGVGYTDQYGYTYISKIPGETVGAELVPTISDNPFVWDTYREDYRDQQYAYGLHYAALGLAQLPDWVPGEVDYYGDPALDLGDLVRLEGGINGSNAALFLITADSWQFRGPQKLISAGAGETGLSGSSGSSTSSVITTINLTKTLTAVELLSYEGELFPRLRTVARGGFAVRSETVIFVELTANLTGEGDIRLHVLYDGVKQTVHSRETAPERSTVSYSVQLTAQQGIHTIEVEAAGNAVLERITALVWGQDITAVQPEYSSESDYEYTVSDGATIDLYIGRSTMPQIPDSLGGAPVRVIGSSSFTDSAVECVYIPDGVEVIE